MKAVRYDTKFHNVWFTGDQHFFHRSVIRFHRQQFRNCDEMHEALISNHNEVVKEKDYVIHLGDFSFGPVEETWKIICRLNGTHMFLEGCHDDTILRISRRPEYNLKMVGRLYFIRVDHQHISCSHYCMRTWPRKHYGTWNTHAHSHGKLEQAEKCPHCGEHIDRAQYDVGVDNNNLYPISYEQLKEKCNVC